MFDHVPYLSSGGHLPGPKSQHPKVCAVVMGLLIAEGNTKQFPNQSHWLEGNVLYS